jgi:hypothetical protein
MSFDRAALAQAVQQLAKRGAYIGTSSWKYEGWLGMLYDPRRYEYRGKVAMKRFEQNCLREYAEVFKTVCVDAAFYKFPDHKFLDGMMSQRRLSIRIQSHGHDHGNVTNNAPKPLS